MTQKHIAVASGSAESTTMASGGPAPFAFPPLHNFAPFFTLQRNTQTRESQLAAWTRLVLDYCQAQRIFVLDIEGAWERTTGAGGLFRNKALDRSLSADAQRTVFGALVEQGAAAWDPPLGKAAARVAAAAAGPDGGGSGAALGNRILVFWRRPEAWGELIYAWISGTGQNGSIMTFFELTEGDLVQDQGGSSKDRRTALFSFARYSSWLQG